ncbi:TetR/AcrR family transcriptional regulator [Streptosporangium sp. NPDC050855]|uniref:TetR/AcrR family transcriptional regulator n=1 Tax=Streptosporangium sp. NPDC050855 TaxID=3366194 RepID=UPI0037B376B3
MTEGTPDGDGTSPPEQTGRTGRKRDHTRDAQILDATLDVLAEVGYSGMTMDMVAARAKAGKATVYRRWSSKGELVVDAIARMKSGKADVGNLPDTGTLRGDLLALYRPQTIEEGERTLRIMTALASMISTDPTFAGAADTALVKPWADAHLAFMRRAVDRGEIPATADIETLSRVVPTMAAYRALVQRRPFDREFLVTLVDGVIMPALLG